MLDSYDETRQWRNERLTESLNRTAEALKAQLPTWEWQMPLGGPHLWLKLPDTDAVAFSHRLM